MMVVRCYKQYVYHEVLINDLLYVLFSRIDLVLSSVHFIIILLGQEG